MPRTARLHAPGCLVHLVSRFVDGRFLVQDEDRAFYLEALDRVLPYTDWKLLSYALMSSHVHLGLVAGDAPLSSWVKPVHERFSIGLGRRLRADNPKALGHVFADRPKTLVSSLERAPFLIAYHHNNPVRAGVVDEPQESAWTSHRAYLGLSGAGCRCLDVELGLTLSGFGGEPGGVQLFHEFVRSDAEEAGSDDPGNAPTGSLGPPRSRMVTTRGRPQANEVVARVCEELAIPPDAVGGAFRGARAVEARRTALQAWRELGGTMATMAAELHISRSAASKILSRADRTSAASERARSLARGMWSTISLDKAGRSVPDVNSEG